MRRSVLLLIGLVLVGAALAGCADRPAAQVTTVETPATTTGTLTPLEKGILRRDVLRAARPAVTAFLTDSPAEIAKYWDENYVKIFANSRAKYLKEQKQRVRKHKEMMLDVVELNDEGTQALVQYRFADQSYWADMSGKATSKPSNKETEMQLTLDKKAKGWIVTRMIAGDEAYK